MLEKKSNMNCVVKQQYRKLSSLGESSSQYHISYIVIWTIMDTGWRLKQM